MSSPSNSVTRVTQTLRAVTSQIFRCHGLQNIPGDADRFGTHDLAWWLVFLGVLSGWFLFIFAPQSDRLNMLKDRHEVLNVQLKEHGKELTRLQRGIADLTGGSPTAWERAARGRLGWVEPGELTDLVAWNQSRATGAQHFGESANPAQINRPNPLPNMLPRPRIPSLPIPPASQGPPRLVVATDTLNSDKIGPILGSPPPPPVTPLKRARVVIPAVAAVEVRRRHGANSRN